MEATRKKELKIAICIVCFGLAGGLTFHFFRTGSGGSGIEQFAGETIWAKCSNPSCDAEYEIDKKGYYLYMQEHKIGFSIPPMPCKECKQESLYRAVKCPSCDRVFYYGAAQGEDHPDRCPHCDYSETEEQRKSP